MEIQHGTLLTCETASGGHVTMRALGPQTPGDWLTGIPWPLTSVQATEDAEVFEAMAS